MNSIPNGVGAPNYSNGSTLTNGLDVSNGTVAASGLWERYEEVQAHSLEANRLLSVRSRHPSIGR